MGRRWAWMGMAGVCALLMGCKQREIHEQAAPVSARAPAPARPSASTSVDRVSTAPTTSTPEALPAPRSLAQPSGAAPARAGAPTQGMAASSTTSTPAQAAPRGAPATASPAQQQAREGRVMIGMEAIQASEDEAWYEGAAKAARAARQNDSVPLERVVIATGTVDGRVIRVARNMVHVRDSEGNVYQLRVDKRTRGLREGLSVPLQQLGEGTPVHASFDLMGGSSFARDIEVRR